MRAKFLCLLITIVAFLGAEPVQSQTHEVREHLSMDTNWKFAYGHPYEAREDYFHGTRYFSYVTKHGYGDGPAAKEFDDRSWRTLDVPHDWAVEQGFSPEASHSHGYKTVGPGFPATSVGWYRKSFHIPETDTSKRISIQFDGVHRDSKVFINGFYLGNEASGYYDFVYDLTPYLNYGDENVIAVRVDVTMEEGWFYEGAGIYRHVWLTKTDPLHVAYNGTFVKSKVHDNSATLTVETEINNDYYTDKSFRLVHRVIDPGGNEVASVSEADRAIEAYATSTISSKVEVKNPDLWSLENPHLYKLETQVVQDSEVVDDYRTTFGIRTISFDADEGFFLNGKHVKIKGTCNHQDHAGVGTAIPDALQEYRIRRLKSMGSNAYRAAHNPPTPELLDAADKLGMLVMVENRLLSTAPDAMDRLKRMIRRDRNHPSVIVWSLGNEEWAVEGNEKGGRIVNELQAFAKQLDDTRPYTLAKSGGWGHGDENLDILGLNYLRHGDADAHHKQHPDQYMIGTEESTTQGTRGVYHDDSTNGHMVYVDRSPGGTRIQNGWKFYDERDYLSGVFLWTGFDYRGEPNPLNYPAVSSQFGILDLCGFPKEPYYYLRSWWDEEDFINITPHWNWQGKEGDSIQVRVNSNVESVELYLNDELLSKKGMKENGLLNWFVPYQPGVLAAKGYRKDEMVAADRVETTGEASSIQLMPDRNIIQADGDDVSVIRVSALDKQGREVPVADHQITFEIEGPANIIGVGNGDPGSHERDVFNTGPRQLLLDNGKIAVVEESRPQPEVQPGFDDSSWPVYETSREQMIFPRDETVVVRVEFELSDVEAGTDFTLYSKSLALDQSIYLNGKRIADQIKRDTLGQVFTLDNELLKTGTNHLAYKGKALYKRSRWEELNTDPGLIQIKPPKEQWKRRLFNGLAQIIIQSTEDAGEVRLTATSPELKDAEITITAEEATIKPNVE